MFLLPTSKDGLLPKNPTWQAKSCVEGIASKEIN